MFDSEDGLLLLTLGPCGLPGHGMLSTPMKCLILSMHFTSTQLRTVISIAWQAPSISCQHLAMELLRTFLALKKFTDKIIF